MADQGLETIAGRAVEAAVGAGAGDAEAFVQDSTGLQVRIFDQRVESLTEAGERGLGVRVWIDGRAGLPTAPTSATAASARSPRSPRSVP